MHLPNDFMRMHVQFGPNTVPGFETNISIPSPWNSIIQRNQRAQNEHYAVLGPQWFRSRLNGDGIATAACATPEHYRVMAHAITQTNAIAVYNGSDKLLRMVCINRNNGPMINKHVPQLEIDSVQ